jgi:hypothetical protein
VWSIARSFWVSFLIVAVAPLDVDDDDDVSLSLPANPTAIQIGAVNDLTNVYFLSDVIRIIMLLPNQIERSF